MTEDTASPIEQPAYSPQQAGVRTQMICDGVVYNLIVEVDPNDSNHLHMRRAQPEPQQ